MTDGFEYLEQAEQALAKTRNPSVEQLTQLSIASFLGGILQELHGSRNSAEDSVSMLNGINAWLRGNAEGRPEVIVHSANSQSRAVREAHALLEEKGWTTT